MSSKDPRFFFSYGLVTWQQFLRLPGKEGIFPFLKNADSLCPSVPTILGGQLALLPPSLTFCPLQ